MNVRNGWCADVKDPSAAGGPRSSNGFQWLPKSVAECMRGMTRRTVPLLFVTTREFQGAPSVWYWVTSPDVMEESAPAGSGLTDWLLELPSVRMEMGAATRST